MSTYTATIQALGIAVMANTPVLLWGPPGQGKTSVVNAMAAEQGLHMETVIASVREPSDFAGLPIVDHATGTVRLAAPGWAQRLTDLGQGIVFYDEISTAPPAVQSALLRPILDNCVGDLQMPESVRTVAAANPADVAAGGWELPAPTANRFVHLNWALDVETVRQGFTTGWPSVPLPTVDADRLSQCITDARLLVASFLSVQPELLTVQPAAMDEENMAYPTPRSWEVAATLYGYAKAANVEQTVINLLVGGTVGHATAMQFLNYVANLDLPDPEELLAHPERWEVPSERGDKVYATLFSAQHALGKNNTTERWHAFGELLGKAAAHNHADLATTFAATWATAPIRQPGCMPKAELLVTMGPILAELPRDTFN